MLNLGRVMAVLAILHAGFLYAASVKAMVDTIEVVKGKPVTLRIKATGNDVEFPKFDSIAGEPIIDISTSQSRNLSIINGNMKSEQSVTKIIQFVPEKNMTIPSYNIKIEGQAYQTEPIDIKVVKPGSASAKKEEIFSLGMQANKTKVMVGEPFVVTVYFSLKEGVRLAQDVQYSAPDLSEFVVTEVDEQKIYKKGNYQVQEIRYILTPQKEGNFTIMPAQAKIGLPDRSRRDIFGLSYATKWMQTFSEKLQIEVVPLEKEYDLIGEFTIDTIVDKTKAKSNKPVNLTVKIEGKGSLEGFEFPKYEIDGVTIYSDDAKSETKIVNGDIYSSYTKSFAFISDRNFTIPSRQLTLYSPAKKEIKKLEVKGFDIEVEGAKLTAQSTHLPSNHLQTSSSVDTTDIDTKSIESKSVSWWMLSLAFGLGMLTLYLWQFISTLQHKKERSYKESDALKILYSHISEDKAVEEMVRKLYAKKNGDKSVQIDKKELKKMLERFR